MDFGSYDKPHKTTESQFVKISERKLHFGGLFTHVTMHRSMLYFRVFLLFMIGLGSGRWVRYVSRSRMAPAESSIPELNSADGAWGSGFRDDKSDFVL